MDLGLAGRACVVTGASSGIGLEVARQLHEEGAGVLMVARGEERLLEAAERIGGTEADPARATDIAPDGAGSGTVPGSAAPGTVPGAAPTGVVAVLALDVTDADAGERMLSAAHERLGGVDVLVNNAGTARWRDLFDVPDEDWRLQYELNVMAPLRAMKAFAPTLAARGWGRVVNVCSTAAKRPSATMPEYSVAKAAELSLSRLFADRYAADGVLINAVCPGAVESELWMEPGGLLDQGVAATGAASREEALAAAASKRPIGRLAGVEEIAAAIVFLCSKRASYVAGSAWSVDGGAVAVII